MSTRFFLVSALALALMSGCSTTGSQLPATPQSAPLAPPGVTHNTWSLKKAIPTSVLCPGGAAIGTKIYVVGGVDSSLTIRNDNQIYDTATNKWSKGAAMPTARWCAGAAVVKNILYMVGGNTTLSGASDVVEAYDPSTNTWSEKAPLPIANAPVAVTDSGLIYAIGGYNGATGRLPNVYRYNPKTNSWAIRQPLKVGRSNPGVALLGTKIVVADGFTNAGVTTETEVYTPQTNRWKVVNSDLTARTAGCSGVAAGNLYLAGGELGGGSQPDTNVNDEYAGKTGAWSAKAKMPQATVAPAYATVGGIVYCISGASSGNPNGATFYNKVQAYQP